MYYYVAISLIDGKIYVYWKKWFDVTIESDFEMILSTLTFDWITNGEVTWTPPIKNKIKIKIY